MSEQEDGRRQERLKNAIAHLGHSTMSVRLGAAYELFHLALDSDGYRRTVQDILCAHIRQTTRKAKYRIDFRTEPSVEIESILSLLFVDGHRVFAKFKADLCGSYLAGAPLRNAHLEGANLTEAWLSEAGLRGASLQGALLGNAYLHCADLAGACLQGAILHYAKLQCANLECTQCQGVSIFGAMMQEATLSGAKFHGAKSWTDYVTDDQHAAFTDPVRRGYRGSSKIPSFQERIRKSVGKESQIGEVTFEGGMRQELVDELSASLTDRNRKALQQKMSQHLGSSRQRQTTDQCGIRTGSYNDEEAAEFIRKYPKSS